MRVVVWEESICITPATTCHVAHGVTCYDVLYRVLYDTRCAVLRYVFNHVWYAGPCRRAARLRGERYLRFSMRNSP
eukprot:5711033-Lingulodinium_polyedra.AAC.1